MSKRIALVATFCWCTSVAMAQGPHPRPDTTGCWACIGGLGFLLLIPVVILIINIALLVWIARDAKARGVDGAVVWMIFAFFTGPIAWLLYLLSRPSGNVVRCHRCGNGRLQVAATCPHCGNA